MPLIPWHCLVICSHLLLLCGGLFARLFVVLSPPGLLFLLVLGRAFLVLCLFLVFSLVPLLLWLLCVVFFCWCFCLRLRLSSLWPLWAAFGVVGLPWLLFLLCCGRLPSPTDCCLPLPFGCSLAASWSSYCAGPSLWVSGCFM